MRPGQVCKRCNRGTSTKGNEIVFCDGCNTPYHQLCHEPAIDAIVVNVADAQWFCAACQAQRPGLRLETGRAGAGLDPGTKATYLSALSRSQLVQLIQYAEKLHPDLPLYSPNVHKYVARIRAENGVRTHPAAGPQRANYEDLLVGVVADLQGPNGVGMPEIWKEAAIRSMKPSDPEFQHTTIRALQRCLRQARLVKRSGRYTVNKAYKPALDSYLTLLLKADDAVIFKPMPLRLHISEVPPLEHADAFSHRVYSPAVSVDGQPT